jgi:putative ABC transport system permease protein
MFSFIVAVLLKPLAYNDPERLVLVWKQLTNGNTGPPDISMFQEWRSKNQVFSHLAATTLSGGDLNLTSSDRAELIQGEFVSANYFAMLGVQPVLGRSFAEDEDQPGKQHVVVLTNASWRRRFGADPNVLGSSITLNNEKYAVIGVLPPHRIFDRDSTGVWLPLVFTPEQIRTKSQFFMVMGRLKPDVTLAQADAEMKRITEGMAAQGRTDKKDVSAAVKDLQEHIVGRDRPKALMVLMGAVALILLIGCANVANLLLARGAVRQREIAIRAALGASRWRLARQLLTESMLLALISGIVGVFLAFWLMKAFTSFMPRITLPIEAEVTLDWRVLLFTLGASLVTGVLFGLAPAWQAARLNLSKPLQEGSAGASARLSRNKSRSVLLVSEVALTFVLVIGSSLLLKSFARLTQVDPGFQTEGLLTFRTNLDKTRYPEAHSLLDYQTELLDRISALPGMRQAAASNALPLGGTSTNTVIEISGSAPGDSSARQPVGMRLISPSYFNALRITLVRGRLPMERDTSQSPPVMIINQSLARRAWPDRDPIGEQIKLAGDIFTELSFTIVGVVADVRHTSLDTGPVSEVYLLFSQMPEKALTAFGRSLQFAVLTEAEPAAISPAIQALAVGVDKDQPIYGIKTMDQMYSGTIAVPRFRTILFGLFGALALMLAAVGIYGVMSYSVSQRTREIGIRVALGAQGRDVLAMVLRQAMLLSLAGVAIGLAAALGLTRYLSSFLFEVTATDTATYFAVSLLLAGVALLACYVPARRASRVDPMVALRYE